MVLALINKYKDQYKEVISSGGPDDDGALQSKYHPRAQDALYNWESLKTFQDNWNTDASDFKLMYERSFANTLANDLWEGHSYFPKKAMLSFIDRDPDLIRSMFKELFSENLDIEGRIDRFVYHCDEISRDIMRTSPKYQSHYHDGYRMISVYLAFTYPMQYTIYQFDAYKKFMEMIKAKPEVGPHEIGRFFKAMRTVYSIISKDEELLEMHRDLRAERGDLYQGESLLLVSQFYWFCGELNV